MTDAAITLAPADRSRALNGLISSWAIWLGAFLGGFVINEPAPYELYFAGLIGIWALFGFIIPRAISPLVALLVVFNIGGIISMMTMPQWKSAPIYVAVSFFLAFTSIFLASVIAADHRRLKYVINGYLVAALLTSVVGILGYLGAIPGAETFTRYGRARGAFEDPNVFAPFLMLPAMWCLYGVFTQPLKTVLPRMIMLLIITLGIFLSFSRAGWGMFIVCASMVAGICVMLSGTGRQTVRILLMAIFALVVLVFALLIALQFEAIADVFVERAQLVQDYDGAREGRFARHWIGLLMATQHPFGIGPLEFGVIFGEDTHNIWLKALFDYSWLGFIAYMLLVFWTLGAGFKLIFRDRPWRGILICAWVVFVGHMMIGNVIDTDHWRHFFLILGIIWGCIALEAKHQSGRNAYTMRSLH